VAGATLEPYVDRVITRCITRSWSRSAGAVASPRLNARGRPYGVGVAEAERQHLLELLSELRKVDAWVARMDPSTRPPGPQPGSSLYGDDARTHPYELSHGAWHALSHAVDHLNCLHVLLKDAQVIHMFAPFSLVRAALENASAAVWMLQPPSRTSRVCRRFRFAVANIRNGDAAKQLARLEGGRPQDVLIDEVRELARQAGVTAAEATKKVGYQEVVTSAASALGQDTAVIPFAWRLCSGISHGDFWTTLSAAQRTELPGAPPGIGSFRVTANVQTLMYVTTFAVRMTGLGWRLYDRRSQPPY